jgi:hypothetical protein
MAPKRRVKAPDRQRRNIEVMSGAEDALLLLILVESLSPAS